MRLINAHTLKLEEVWDKDVKEYAILSHRWEDDEVSFQDMQNPAVAATMKGFAKIQKSCEHAVINGYDYVWVDTCCINKESSAELSEAINSMYRWYKASAICYVFLSDVHANALNVDTVEQQIMSSMWFTRGWTLQELLAPQYVVFYDQQWDFLGTKQTLTKLLTQRTGIDEVILDGEPLSKRSIAQRMSWASHRVTTRVEDTAYCLLGIFDVNMPMLYGEGEKAFLRLQEEIVKQSDDHTIFAWPIHRNCQPGLFADSPAAFANCQHITTMTSRKGRSPYSVTNRGLSIKLKATPFTTDTYLVPLYCTDGLLLADDGPTDKFRLGMFLRRLNEDDQYARVNHEGKTFKQFKASYWDQEASNSKASKWDPDANVPLCLPRTMRPVEEIDINVRQQFTEPNTTHYKDRVNGFRIATPETLERSRSGEDRFKVSASNWNLQERIMSLKPGNFGTVGSVDISKQRRKIKVIKFGFDFEYNPACFIATEDVIGRENPQDSVGFNFLTEDLKKFPGIYQRNPFSKILWSNVRNGVATKMYAGLWAVKGDRINGVNVQIPSLASLRIVRGEFHNKVVWDVYLDNLRDSAFRALLK